MARRNADDRDARAVNRATALITEALDLLDSQKQCSDAAAHLDLALRVLREHGETGCRT